MPRIYSTFADHPAAQRAVDRMVQAGFADSDVYVDPNWRRDLFAPDAHPADGPGPHSEAGQGVLRSIGHALASVVGMDTPDAEAQPFMEGRRRGGTRVVVDALGAAQARQAVQLLGECGGMDIHEAGRRPPSPTVDRGQSEDEDRARNAEAQRRRTVERALAADQAISGRTWDGEAPRAGADERS